MPRGGVLSKVVVTYTIALFFCQCQKRFRTQLRRLSPCRSTSKSASKSKPDNRTVLGMTAVSLNSSISTGVHFSETCAPS